MDKEKSKQSDYRVINVPYEFKNQSSDTVVFDKAKPKKTIDNPPKKDDRLSQMRRAKKPQKPSLRALEDKKEKKQKKHKKPVEKNPQPTIGKTGKKISVIMGGKLKRVARFKKLLAAAALMLVLFIILNIAIPIGFVDATGEFFAGFSASGEGFPLNISSSSGEYISGVGTDLALLCESTLILYNSGGKQIYNRPHGFANPALATSSYRALVYDRGGKGYRIERRRGTVLEGTADMEIITGAIGEKGGFVLATRSGSYVSDVVAFDENGNEKCTWHSSERQVVSVAVSDNGRYMGVGTLAGENGKMVSSILIFALNGGTVICDQSFEGSNVVSLDFKGNVLVGVLDNMLTSINTKGERTDFSLESGKVSCFAQSSSSVAVTVEKYNDSANNQLMIFDKKLQRLCAADIGAEAVSLSLTGTKAVVLSGEKVVSFNSRGEKIKEQEASADARQIITSGAGTALLGSVTLEGRKV